MKFLVLRLSLILLIIGVVMTALTFYIFHYVDDKCKPTLTFHKQAQKPFVAMVFGVFSTLCLFTSMLSLIVALVIYA